MADSITKRYAVVTGANKGIGFEVCRQLALNGIVVVLTSRDEKRGLEAVRKLKEDARLSDYIVFHRLDVTDAASISSLAEFIKTQFGKLDILVNNAGIGGAVVDAEAFKAASAASKETGQINWNGIMTQTYEAAKAGIETNFYGAKRMVKALTDLLQQSHSPRIVNVSSSMGEVEGVGNERAKRVLSDAENLTEEGVDEVVRSFLEDFWNGDFEAKGWPAHFSSYIISKAAMNAYTKILAKKYPYIIVNSVCPGYVKTDINFNTGVLSAEEGAETPVKAALLPNDGPSGCFFVRKTESPFDL